MALMHCIVRMQTPCACVRRYCLRLHKIEADQTLKILRTSIIDWPVV